MENKDTIKDTITDAINAWLLEYEKIKEFADVHIEELPDKVETLALQRVGVYRLSPKYIGEKKLRKEYSYILMLKLDSESDEQRKNALNWLDNLGEWIEEKDRKNERPQIENKQCYGVYCSDEISYETDTQNNVTIYYIQLIFGIKEDE